MNPVISKGIGALTPAVWKRIIEAVQYIETTQGKNTSNDARVTNRDIEPNFFIAIISESAALQTSGGFITRYKYGWARRQLGATNTVAPTSAGNFGALGGSNAAGEPVTFAININELGNTAALQCGYEINTTTNDIKDAVGFQVKPIANGQAVLMQTIRTTGTSADGGRLQYIFSCVNPVVGVCPEA